ncbi:MAG: hypothetical protein CL422_00260 [Acidimicrobiaceae bacterium]|nr:hypothetical protein [Acidimicrobiaceae bacterium]
MIRTTLAKSLNGTQRCKTGTEIRLSKLQRFTPTSADTGAERDRSGLGEESAQSLRNAKFEIEDLQPISPG